MSNNPTPGTWPTHNFSQAHMHMQQQTQQGEVYNAMTGHYFSVHTEGPNMPQNYRGMRTEMDRNERIQQNGGTSFYADAVLKGPRLEIPLFSGEGPIG